MSSHPSLANGAPVPSRTLPLRQPTLELLERRIGASLPCPLTSVIGREAEIASARRVLLDEGIRLLTLIGPGGVGKSRLALCIADDVTPAFPDGVVFVSLAPISDPRLVVPAIARQLGLQDVGATGPRDSLIAELYGRRALLVLDNFEQVRPAAPELVTLLAACPDLVILTTSRAPLRVKGERRFAVLPLGLPLPETPGTREKKATSVRPSGGPLPIREDVARSAAVQLFVERAQANEPRFTLCHDNHDAVAAICRRLDGLPLAIELAAARIPMLTPAELLARFDHALPYLSHGPVDAPHRQRTMRDAIGWSYDLLEPAEQALFRRLAVFVGGFTVEAAAALSGRLSALPGAALGSSFSSLIDHSLLRRAPSSDGEPRFDLLETVREFGLEALAASGEEEAVRDAHCAFMLNLAERAEVELQDAAWQAWAARLARELPNIRAALAYLRTRGDGARAVRLAGALCLFWTQPGYIREGRSWLETVIALPGADREPEPLARALNSLAVVAQWQHDFACVEASLTQALAIRQALHDELGVAEVLGNLGNAALGTGDLARAEELLADALAMYERHGRTYWVGETLTLLGHTTRARGQAGRSVALHTAAVETLRRLPGKNKLADALISLGWAELLRENLAPARAAYREAIALAESANDRMRVGRCIMGAAGLAAAGGDPQQAARLLGAAAAQRDEEQLLLKSTIQGEHDRLTARVRTALGETRFAAAWAAGRARQLEDAAVEARAILNDDWRPGRSTGLGALPHLTRVTPSGTRLTPREMQVLRLVSAGKSDKEIASELFISPRTASTHVAAIIGKLGVSSRTAAVAIAVRDLL